jgi:hypothetical protein
VDTSNKRIWINSSGTGNGVGCTHGWKHFNYYIDEVHELMHEADKLYEVNYEKKLRRKMTMKSIMNSMQRTNYSN